MHASFLSQVGAIISRSPPAAPILQAQHKLAGLFREAPAAAGCSGAAAAEANGAAANGAAKAAPPAAGSNGGGFSFGFKL